MAVAEEGQTVKVHYTGRLEDGSVFDTSEGGAPLEFTIGGGQVIPGFEEGVTGMSPGESKTVEVECADAYGQRRDDMIIEVDREKLEEHVQPQVGQQLEMQDEQGGTFIVTVSDIGADSVVLDANHPLAGKDLVFDIELVEVED